MLVVLVQLHLAMAAAPPVPSAFFPPSSDAEARTHTDARCEVEYAAALIDHDCDAACSAESKTSCSMFLLIQSSCLVH